MDLWSTDGYLLRREQLRLKMFSDFLRRIVAILITTGVIICTGFGASQTRAFASDSASAPSVRLSQEFTLWTPYYVRAQFLGYRIYPKGDRAFYESLGLAVADHVIAINGLKLTDSELAIELVRKLSTGVPAILTMQRNGRSIDVDIPAR